MPFKASDIRYCVVNQTRFLMNYSYNIGGGATLLMEGSRKAGPQTAELDWGEEM